MVGAAGADGPGGPDRSSTRGGSITTVGPTGRDGPHAFVADVVHPVLDDVDRHHLGRVVRLRPGDTLTVSDGRGRWVRCRYGDDLDVVGEVQLVPEPAPRLTVAFALVKGARPEWIVQKLTEVGVDRICPFVAARSVVRWSADKVESHVERLRRVAREAAMQSRRCWLPEVAPLVPFAEVAGLPGAVLADREGVAVSAAATTVLVGPEGGWDAEERVGRTTVSLGDAVLRAETAAVAAGVLLTALRAGIVAEARQSADE